MNQNGLFDGNIHHLVLQHVHIGADVHNLAFQYDGAMAAAIQRGVVLLDGMLRWPHDVNQCLRKFNTTWIGQGYAHILSQPLKPHTQQKTSIATSSNENKARLIYFCYAIFETYKEGFPKHFKLCFSLTLCHS